MSTRIAAVAAECGRGLRRGLDQVLGQIEAARADGIDLLVLPEACLGGYLADLSDTDSALERDDPGPPELSVTGPELAELAEAAGELVVCLGFCERADDQRFNSAVCFSGAGADVRTHRRPTVRTGTPAARRGGGARRRPGSEPCRQANGPTMSGASHPEQQVLPHTPSIAAGRQHCVNRSQ